MSLPFFNFYPKDFEADTSHLTLEEDGAYNRLLRLCWMTPGCSIPDDDAWIARRMRVDSEAFERAVRPVLAEFFVRKGGRVSNPRLSKEHAKSDVAHQRRVSAGSAGGNAKARKNNENAPSNAKAMLKQPEPEPDKKKERGKPLSARVQIRPERFDEFWDAYPHRGGTKKGRKPAEARYAAAMRSGVPEQTIIDGAIRARGDPQVIRGYARDPATWLSQAGWDDEIQTDPLEKPKGQNNGWTDAWQSALADARMADRQGDGPSLALLHPGDRPGGGEGASGGLVRYPLGRAAG
jgi:uncharacterized protein YdaU (DUF1376 family)